MNLPRKIAIFLACLLVSCSPAQVTQFPEVKITPSKTVSESVLLVTPTVLLLPTPTATLAPAISISKIQEWKADYPIAWFTNSSRFVILRETSLDVYDSSLNLILSVPEDASQLDAVVAISPDDKTIALYDSYQQGVVLLDSFTGKQKATSNQDNCMIQIYTSNMLFTPNNQLIIGFDGELDKGNRPIQISAWNTSPLHCLGNKIKISVQEGEPSIIYAIKTSPDGEYFATISTHIYNEYQGIIRVWNSNNLRLICEIPGIYASFRPTDGLLAVINKEGDTLSYFNVKKCSVSQFLKLPAYAQEQEMEFTPNGKYLIFLRHGFQIFDAYNGDLVFDDKLDIYGGFGVLKISPDGKYLLSIHADKGSVTALWKINNNLLP
jgi:WD40 repeat protein